MFIKDLLRPLYRYIIYLISVQRFNKIKDARNSVVVLDSWQTIEYIKQNRCSISRFGDGEISLVLKHVFGEEFHSNFQTFNPALAQRLADIMSYKEPVANHIAGLPACGFGFGTSRFKWNIAEYWNRYMYNYIDQILKLTNCSRTYCDTNFTRFYMDYAETSWCKEYVEGLKSIWAERNIIFVEGETTRLGAGNDLFSTANSIRRILCPPKNAFDRYDDIMEAIRKHASKDDLLICALGMTATVMTYDLAKDGYQALDLGHIDIEYEWFRMGAKEKVAITGKYTNENANGKKNIANGDKVYQSQIIEKIV